MERFTSKVYGLGAKNDDSERVVMVGAHMGFPTQKNAQR